MLLYECLSPFYLDQDFYVDHVFDKIVRTIFNINFFYIIHEF